MKGHFVLQRGVWAAGTCVLLLGILMASVVWAGGPSPSPAGDISSAGGEAAGTVALADSGSRSAPLEPADAGRAVREAWERAREAGIYRFATDLTETSYPALTLSNAGRSPRQTEIHLEGEIDQPARTMSYQLQLGTAGPGEAGSGAEVRVEGDRAYTRQTGGEWQEIKDFSSSFAPDNDPLAFLAGIKDITDCSLEARSAGPLQAGAANPAQTAAPAVASVACYRFTMNGPALAIYLRDRTERELLEAGDLPQGVELEVSSSIRDMTGNGELWVDGRGLPLRLTMHLVFPQERDGSHSEADIQTAFSGFPEMASAPAFSQDPVAWAGAALGLDDPSLPDRAAEAAGVGGVLACSLGVVALLLVQHRSRRLYAAVVIAVILSMVIVPLFEDQRVAAFFERQEARSQDLLVLGANGQAVDPQAAQQEEAAQQTAADLLEPVWNPQQDPLAQPDQAEAQAATASVAFAGLRAEPLAPGAPESLSAPLGAALDCDQQDTGDTDLDGVNNYEECVYGLSSSTSDANGDGLIDGQDTDTDGLTDSQELNKLGTNPTLKDTDGDLISDKVEVQGFQYGTQTWYLDPNNADTNNDGLADSAECPVLFRIANPTYDQIKAECDTDGDGIPNPFEVDNDADGVPDSVDLSPDMWADTGGPDSGQATAATAFDHATPFLLSVPGLQENRTAFVDVQFRPVEAEHLSYAMNVLDWPEGDVAGQIQHGADGTFASSNNPDITNPIDTAGANGDMRLVPLLEIVMPGDVGSAIPLKLTTPEATVAVGSGTAVSSTVILQPGSTLADTQITFLAGASLSIFNGTCAAQGGEIGHFTGGSGTFIGTTVVELADGNHSAVVTQGSVSACADLPDVVNGPYSDWMVDTSVLDPYGIVIKEGYGSNDKAVVAYVPPDVVTDDTGGGKTAFQAHMPFWAGGQSSWNEPVQMRVIWLVQMITDSCADSGDALKWGEYLEQYPNATTEEYNDYIDAYCRDNRTIEQIVPVQVYDESWYLSGLSVQEAHGLDVAVAYPNNYWAPSDEPLWTLAWGLARQFLTGRDCLPQGTNWTLPAPSTCADDKVRDLSVYKTTSAPDGSSQVIGNSTIEERFSEVSTVHSDYRWGIEQSALKVKSFRYAHQDEAGYIAMVETPAILADYSTTVTPTLLFAYEERLRSADLVSATVESGASGVAFTLDMDGAKHPEETLTGIKWAPFYYDERVVDGQTLGWQTFPSDEYWTVQEADLTRRFQALFPGDSDETTLGRVATARSYTVGLIIGVGGPVYCTPADPRCPKVDEAGTSDHELATATTTMLGGLNHVTVELMFGLMDAKKQIRTSGTAYDQTRIGQTEELRENVQRMTAGTAWTAVTHPEVVFFEAMGAAAVSPAASPWQTVITSGPTPGAALGFDFGAAFPGVVAFVNANRALLEEIAFYVYQAVYGTIEVVLFCKAVYTLYSIASSLYGQFVGLLEAAKDSMGFLKNVKSMGGVLSVVTSALTIGMAWVKFFVQFAFTPGSQAFDQALVSAIATTIVTIVITIIILALGPFGSLISTIKALLDTLAKTLCHVFLTEQEQQKEEWAQWVCGGVTGLLTKLIESLIYSGTILVDMDPYASDPWYPRLNIYGLRPILVNEEDGMVKGNSVRYTAGVTTTIMLVDPPVAGHEQVWKYQFSDENLAMANFDYKWQREELEFHDSLGLGGMSASWNGKDDGPPFYYTETVATVQDVFLPEAGINLTIPNLYLSEAYAVPEQECWGLSLIKYCYIPAEKATLHYDMGSNIRNDVLPPTLTGLYELVHKGKGYALAWEQDGDLTFPTLTDADGDGLPWMDDPDDSSWDADGDGLSDVYELNNGLNPLEADADVDGLTDVQEVRLGTDPWSRDTDGDGLIDCQEVWHEVLSTGDNIARALCGPLGSWSGGWDIVYKMDATTRLTTRVTSNPLAVDTDGDGLNDSQEKLFAYNPRLYSSLNVLSLESTLSEPGQAVSDGFVLPGQTLAYTATVKNELDLRRAQGLLSARSPILDTSGAVPQSFDLSALAQVTMTGDLVVGDAAASGTYSLTQVAGALITNPDESRRPSLWLPFDGESGYPDTSGNWPTHDGHCVGTCILEPTGGRIGGALKLGGAGYVYSDRSVANDGFSVSFWFKTANAAAAATLFEARANATRSLVHIYLNAGGLFVASEWGITQKYPIVADKWYHVVVTDPGYGGGTGQMILYVNGSQAWTATRTDHYTASTGGVYIGHGPSGYLNGSIDDLRLFEHVLTPAQVAQLYDTPLFHMDFSDSSAWKDVSDSPTTVSRTPGTTVDHEPTHSSSFSGRAAAFDGSDYLTVSGADKLSLSEGRFTLSAWIYPKLHGDDRDNEEQGILGYSEGGTYSYPTLQRVGKKIRFGMRTETNDRASFTTAADVLTPNQWNHVAVTYDKDLNQGTVQVYVNGDFKEKKTNFGVPGDLDSGFDIGRTSRTGKLDGTGFWVTAIDDRCDISDKYIWSNLCMSMNSVQVQSADVNACKGYAFVGGVSFGERVDLVQWEDDGSPWCGSGPSQQRPDSDDGCGLTLNGASKGLSMRFTTDDAGFTNRRYDYYCPEDGTGGHFTLTYSHDSIPFYGQMDEVWIHGQALGPNLIKQLYLDIATELHLPLDEAPGAVAFRDVSTANVPAQCGGGCPVSGSTGRLNGAAWFDGVDDAIEIENFGSFITTTISAWIYRTGDTGDRETVVSYKEGASGGCGSVLALENDVPKFWVNVGGGWKAVTDIGHPVPLNQWVHLAGTYDGSRLRLFRNAEVVAEETGLTGGMQQCTAKTAIGSRNSLDLHHFPGLIDDVWILGQALPTNWIGELYDRVPDLHLRFEEDHDADQFADNASSTRFGECRRQGEGTCTAAEGCCPTTGEAVRGQIGLAAEFDGQNDAVEIEDFGSFTTLSVSAWIYRTGATATRETIVSYKESLPAGFLLDLNDQPPNHYPRFYVRVGSYWRYVTDQSNPVPLNQWVHLAGTYDGSKLRLYRNGNEVASADYAGSMTQGVAPTGIGSRNSLNQHWFPGRIDEVRIYDRALTASEIKYQQGYEASWFEDRQTQHLTVDDDEPTAELLVPTGSYLANQEIVVGMVATDTTSYVDKMELGVQQGSGATSWTQAARCTGSENQPEGAWCARFTPSGQGEHTLYARATDSVGHVGPAAWVKVQVDDTPPDLVLDQDNLQVVNVGQSADAPNTWLVHLSGTATDPSLGASIAGSGVPTDGVRVTLFLAGDAEGKALGELDQTASVSPDGTWSLDYAFNKAEADGTYLLEVEAVDRVARIPDLGAAQVARHTRTEWPTIVLDARAPKVVLDQKADIVGGQLGPDVTALGGAVSDRAVEVRVSMTAKTGAEQTRVWLTCRHADGTAYTLLDLAEGALQAGDTPQWEGDIHHGSSCQVNLATSAATAEVTGTVKVCSDPIVSWQGGFSGSRTVPFTVHSGLCAGTATPGPASEPPWDGEALRLSFEEGPGSLKFHDTSGNGNVAACLDAARCPAAGQPGHPGGAVLFDGTDDYMTVPGQIQPGSSPFTVAFWAKRGRFGEEDYIVSQGPGDLVTEDFYMGFTPGNSFFFGFGSDIIITSDPTDLNWHHWALTREWRLEGGSLFHYMTLYRDGVFLTEAKTTATHNLPSNDLNIGRIREPHNAYYFKGSLDDLRVFDRALTAAEVRALYIGYGPVLHLPLDTSPATGGTVLPDLSAWGNSGTLATGDTENKAVPGQVGSYALWFDGSNDYVTVPHNATFDAIETEDKVTIAAWVKVAGWYQGFFPIADKYEANGDYGWSLYLHSSSGMIFNLAFGVYTTCKFVPPLNQWVHLAVSYDRSAGRARFYVNGAQQCDNSFTGDFTDTAGEPLYLGYLRSGLDKYSNGVLDDVRIYGRALAADEVEALYSAGWQSAGVAGVQGVDLAFTPILPGSAFFNEVPLQNEVLHLPFEDSVTSQGGLVLRDVSGAGANGTCTNCPIMGQAGPSGNAARFDGVDDYVSVASPTSVANSSFTAAFWAKRGAAGDWDLAISQGSVSTNKLLHIGFRSNNLFTCAFYSNDVDTKKAYTDLDWHHWACTYDSSKNTRTIYRDGAKVETNDPTGSGLYTGSGPLSVGRYRSYYFNGLLDEVRIFGRALEPAEVMDLYRGSGPMLALPFEEPWATDGDILHDGSGRGNDGTLETGTTDAANKAVTGQVGLYGLALDGVDDYVSAGSRIDLANASFSVAFWAKRDAAGRYDVAVSHGTVGTNTLLHVGFRDNNVFTCGFYRNDLNTGSSYPETDWHHWACTYDASTNTRTIYRDGAQVAQAVAPADYQGSGELYVGRYTTTYFGGSLDDLRIYPRALPAAEVVDLFHAGWQAANLLPSGDGGVSSAWQYNVPDGLEGSYQVEMRGRDAGGHVAPIDEPSLLWRGEADTLAPRVWMDYVQSGSGVYSSTLVATDYHLDATSYASPCPPEDVSITPEYFGSPWYLGSSGDSQTLYRLTARCQTTRVGGSDYSICDLFGNCTTCTSKGVCNEVAAGAVAAEGLTPGEDRVQGVDDTEATNATVAGAALAARAAKQPPADFVITAPEVVTSSQYYEPRTIDVAGWVTSKRNPHADPNALASVEVAIAGDTGPAILSEPDAHRPYTVTWTFPWQLASGSDLPDGVSYTATITATSAAGRTKVVDHTLIADVVVPSEVMTLSLAANGLPVEPGAIIREPSPDLALTWTPSSDGSGLAPYIAAWRFEDAYTTTIQTSLHDPSGPLEAHVTAGEAQRVSVGLASRDIYGNARLQGFGSVIVDGPLTPDYCSLSEEADITGSTCTLLGVDRRIARRESSHRWTEQRLYGTWDHQALRLAWTGAHWSGDGDLFVYLDTQAGGTTETFTPYTVAVSGTLVTLPTELPADVLIWVQDAGSANLLRWDGSAWTLDAELTPEQYRFDAGRNRGQTDLYLPFDLLGTTAGAPLGLLAFAADEPAPDAGLRVWATLPLANPVNSDRVNLRRVLAAGTSTMPLLHAYRWAALSDGVCPNGTNGVLAAEQHNDAVIELSVASDPPGATATGISGGLFWVSDPLAALAAPTAEPQFGFLRTAQPPVPDGQAIAYTVRYRNEGIHPLKGAWLALTARGALGLSVDTIPLGDIPPGGEGTVTLQGTVDRSLSPYGLAAVVARLYAANSGDKPLEWLAAIHRVDMGAPEEVDLDQPEVVVGPGAGWLRGSSRDESGVSQVEIEITPLSGAASTLTCQVSDPAGGGWSCPWDATAANGGTPPADGDTFTVRLRATDRFGYTSPWSPARTVLVDAQPPTVTLGMDSARLVRGNSLRLTGESLDNHAVGSVTLCLDDGTCRTADLQNAGASSSWWSRWMSVPDALDYVTRTLTISATDRLGNSLLEPLAVPVVFDGVAPVMSANQILDQVPLGSAQTVLSGDVTDGGPEVDVSVRVQPPKGDTTRVGAARDGSAWWFDLPAAMAGQYALSVDAEDVAGNLTTAGPFTVTVTCTDAAPAATSLTAEPVAGWPMSLTLTVVISNAGPDALPAGIPIVVSEGITPTGRVTTTIPLAAGESEALSLVWAPDGARDHTVGVTAGQIEALPDGPLCVAPSTVLFELVVSDQELFYGWNLISPLVNPGNTDVEVVQRGIDADYTAILGYDGGLLYYPNRPGYDPLTTVDALHGYWIRAIITPTETLTETRQVGIWRMTGEILPENLPLSLDAGWNLAGYLPARPLTVTTALEGIAGQYGAVLGFERTAVSYYPDLDPSYNTLVHMAPGGGYWISATQAVNLVYPITGISDTLSVTATNVAQWRPSVVREAERQAGVQPTYEWMNFYGEISLPDGSPVPTGTVVLAVDPQDILCGATPVWEPGQFGLLACYRDDPETEADEGALPGDTIRLFISTDGMNPDGELIGEGVWVAHGSRWLVEPPPPPLPDLVIAKQVTPQEALPGAAITYTLVYSNAGDAVAEGVVITDVLPTEILSAAFTSWGAPITQTAGSPAFSWEVADLAPGEGGGIVVTGVLSPGLTGPLTITNTAIITAPQEAQPEDNLAEAVLQVIPPPALVADLAIAKEVTPQAALPGATITYTIVYSNASDAVAEGVIITDIVPTEVLSASFTYWGVPITPTAGSPDYVWQVADLLPGEGGGIVVTGILSPELTGTLAITNTAIITTPQEARPEDNVAQAILQVILGLARLMLVLLRAAQ